MRWRPRCRGYVKGIFQTKTLSYVYQNRCYFIIGIRIFWNELWKLKKENVPVTIAD